LPIENFTGKIIGGPEERKGDLFIRRKNEKNENSLNIG